MSFFRVRVALINRLQEINKEKLNKKTELSSPQKRLNEIYDITNKQQDSVRKNNSREYPS